MPLVFSCCVPVWKVEMHFLSVSLERLRCEARAVRSRRLNPCWNVVQPAWERSLVLLILTITVAAAGETMPATHTVDSKCASEADRKGMLIANNPTVA